MRANSGRNSKTSAQVVISIAVTIILISLIVSFQLTFVIMLEGESIAYCLGHAMSKHVMTIDGSIYQEKYFGRYAWHGDYIENFNVEAVMISFELPVCSAVPVYMKRSSSRYRSEVLSIGFAPVFRLRVVGAICTYLYWPLAGLFANRGLFSSRGGGTWSADVGHVPQENKNHTLMYRRCLQVGDHFQLMIWLRVLFSRSLCDSGFILRSWFD